jgi:hypothetical protein
MLRKARRPQRDCEQGRGFNPGVRPFHPGPSGQLAVVTGMVGFEPGPFHRKGPLGRAVDRLGVRLGVDLLPRQYCQAGGPAGEVFARPHAEVALGTLKLNKPLGPPASLVVTAVAGERDGRQRGRLGGRLRVGGRRLVAANGPRGESCEGVVDPGHTTVPIGSVGCTPTSIPGSTYHLSKECRTEVCAPNVAPRAGHTIEVNCLWSTSHSKEAALCPMTRWPGSMKS